MKVLLASLVLLLGAVLAPALVTAGDPEGSAAAAAVPGGGAYPFALAKMLAEEGRLLEALQAFPEAVRQAPDDPFIRIEYAELLLRAAQRYGAGSGRMERMEEAAQQAAVVRRLAPGNLDAQRALGRIELSLADFRPEAMAAAIEALEVVRKRAPDDVQTMVTLGQIYLQQRQPDRAAEVFGEAAANTPGNRMIYSFLAEALHAAGRDAEAEAPQRKLLELDPRALDARLGLAKSLAEKGDHQGAVELLRQAPKEVAESHELRGELAWQLYLVGDYEGALATAEGLLRDAPKDVWPRFVRALSHAAQGKDEEALAELDALRADDPDNLELARTEAGVLERLGRSDEAAAILAELLKRLDAGGDETGADPRARLLLAGVLARSGKREEAATTLEPLLEATDGDVNSQARIDYADLLFDLGRRERALAVLEEGTVGVAALRAKEIELLLRAGDDKRAKKLLAQVQRGGDLDVAVLAAQAVQSQSRWELSLPLLEPAIAAGTKRVQVLFLAGVAYERTGQRDRASDSFRSLLAINPDFAPALNYLGYMWAERGENLAQALEMVEHAVALDPNNGAYVDSLGWAYFQRGDYPEARRYLEQASRLLPDDPTVCEHLADVYVAVGDVARAQQLYRRALDLAAGDAADLRKKLDRLRAD